MSIRKTALVTGGNRGIGYETAKQLGQKGCTVLLGARVFAEAEVAVSSLKSEGLTSIVPIKLDITKAADRTAVAKLILDQYGHLDVLVNNAGVTAPEGTLMEPVTSQVSELELHEVFGTNLFATVLLTQVLLPLIKKSDAGHIVNVSSQLGSLTLHAERSERVAYNKRFAYNASKAALNMFTILLSQELQDTNIKVNSVHPGWVKTRSGTEMAPMNPSEGAKTSVSASLLGPDGDTGRFFFQDEKLPW